MLNSKTKKERDVEKWSDIIRELNINITKPISYVTANQIKEITHKEPRNLAKMDTLECSPQIFREHNLFLLPVTRKKYVIVNGKGHHVLEPIDARTVIHVTRLPLPHLNIKSESVYLDYIYSSGLLQKFLGTSELIRYFSGRTSKTKFSFKFNNIIVDINGAQIEVDVAYRTGKHILIFEAKVVNNMIPSSFNIRQLYYPYRTFIELEKIATNVGYKIKSFFFCFIKKEQSFLFWEYEFKQFDNFESIRLVRSKKFQVRVLPENLFIDKASKPKLEVISIPQADDVNKIIEFPARVFDGYDNSTKMTDAFGFVKRQSNYYREAAEILGLITSEHNQFKVTANGEKLLHLAPEEKSKYVCRLLLLMPIVDEIYKRVTVDRLKVSREDIINLIKSNSALTGSTPRRRSQTIVSWFRWIRNNVGLVELDRDGNISESRQHNLV